MAFSSFLVVLLCSLVLCMQASEQQDSLGRRSKRDTMASSILSAFINLEKRLAAVEATAQRDNSTEERLGNLEAKVTRLQEKMDKRLDDINSNAAILHNASLMAIHGAVHSMTELVAASEQNFKSSMRSVMDILASMISTSETHLVAQVENKTAELITCIARVEQATKDLATRLSALEKEVQSGSEQMGASEKVMFTIQNVTDIWESMLNETKSELLARAKDNSNILNISIVKELATCVSAVEHSVENATSLCTKETEKTRSQCEDTQRQIEGLKNHTTDLNISPRYRRTCQDYYDNSHRTSGVYTLLLDAGQSTMEVYCEMSHGAGWTVFQRRQDGSVNFYRNWKNYEDGFGDFYGEFWLGNKNIHRLTSGGLTQLRVDLQAWDGSTAFASYSHFSVGNASSSYTLSVSGYSGTAGDSLNIDSGHKFSTYDRDHDTWDDNCAQAWKGAWWYRDCTRANLNAEYGTRASNDAQYVHWYDWLDNKSLQRTELKLK